MWRVASRTAVVTAAMAFVLAVAPAGQSRGRGGVTGSAVFDGGPLPGVTVTIANSGVTRTVITNDAGRFEVPDLPEGAYTLTAELPGFQSTKRENLNIQSGRTSVINLVLQPGCLFDAPVSVDLGTPWAIQEADAILHVHISESGPSQRWDSLLDGGAPWCFFGYEYTANLLHVVKSSRVQEVTVNAIRFVQLGSARYQPGEEFVAFLQWDASLTRFRPIVLFMFPVRDGRVEWKRTDTPGLTDGMFVEDFLAAVRALLPNTG